MRKSSVEKFKSILLFPLQLKKQLRKYLTTVIIKGAEQASATVPQNYEYLSKMLRGLEVALGYFSPDRRPW